MTTLQLNFPMRTNMPDEELAIIGQAIRFHAKRHNLKPSSRGLPVVWCCEASDLTVILRDCDEEIARYRYGVSGRYRFAVERPDADMPEGDLIRAAIASHRRRCKRRGDIYQQPSPECSDAEGRVVILRNRYREIARYKRSGKRNRFEYIEAP